ncbi:MAG: T9SS type A sorting domain-containing protein, partial [Candidatus Kapaibacteriota bacterium]
TREVENETLNADNIIYPNPVDDFAYIQTEKFPISVKLINNLGEVLLELNNSYDNKIDFRLLPAGVYFVEISNGTTKIVNKVIKLR